MAAFALPIPGAQQPFSGASVSGEFTERNQVSEFVITLPLASFLPQMRNDSAAFWGPNTFRTQLNLYRAQFAFTGDNDLGRRVATGTLQSGVAGIQVNDLLGVSFTNNASVTLEDGSNFPISASPGAIQARLMSNENTSQRSTLELLWTQLEGINFSDVAGVTGSIQIRVPLIANNAPEFTNAHLTVGSTVEGAGLIIDRWRLWSGIGESTVTISVPNGARTFDSSLRLNPIRVTEARIGTLSRQATDTIWLQLEAPAFYTWSFGVESSVTVHPAGSIIPGRPGTQYQLGTAVGGSISSANIVRVDSFRGNATDSRHTLHIQVNLGRNMSSLTNGHFEITNLWLIPDYNAVEAGNVYVEARLRRFAAASGTPGSPGSPAVPGHYINVPERHPDSLRLNTGSIPATPPVGGEGVITRDNANVQMRWVQIATGNVVDTPGTPAANYRQVPVNVPTGSGTTSSPWNFRSNTGDVVYSIPPTFIIPTAGPFVSTAGVVDTDRTVGGESRDARYLWTLGQLDANGDQIRVSNQTAGAWRVIDVAGTPARHFELSVIQGALTGNTIRVWVPEVPEIPATDDTTVEAGWATVGLSGYDQRLHVGIRGRSALQASVHEITTMRTGHLGQWRGQNVPASNQSGLPTAVGAGNGRFHTLDDGTTNVPWNRDNSGFPHFTGVATGTLIIEETIPGGFSVGFGTPIHFEFLCPETGRSHPGIRVLGVQARAGNNNIDRQRDNPFRNFFTGSQGFIAGTNAAWERQNWMTFAGWVNALDNRLPVTQVARMSDHRTSIYLPSQTITDVTAPGALEIRFFLSLEAGYEWKYGSNVDVTISGAGVANLPEAQRVQTIGIAQDPIATIVTDLNFPVTEVETGTLYNIIGRAPIADVTFDVINPAAFQIGDEIWVYVTSDVLARSFDLNLSGIPSINVEGSRLQFDFGRLVNPQAGRVGREAVAFMVTRAAEPGDNPVVTISNLNVEGQAFPGVEYQLVISGTAVANNDQEIFHASNNNTAYGTQIATMSRGVFTSLPYHGTVVTNVFGGVWDHAPEGGPGGITVPPVRELRLWEGMGAVSGVDVPFFWHRLNDELVVGMVALRTFAYFVGDTNPHWDQADRTAQIRGYDHNGNQVTLAVQAGNTMAAIQNAGQPQQDVDIATAARGASGPAGTVMPLFVNDRIYLPLRFVAETFGYVVSMEGRVVVFR